MSKFLHCPDTFVLITVTPNPIRDAPNWNMVWSCPGCGGAHAWQDADLVAGAPPMLGEKVTAHA